MLAASWRRGWRSWPAQLLAVAAGVTPLLAVLAPLSLIIVLSVTAVATGVVRLVDDRSLPLPRPLLGLVVAFALWSGASVVWAPDWRLAAGLLQSVLLVALGGMILLGAAARLDDAERRRIERCLLVGFLAALGLLAFLGAAYWLFGANLAAMTGWSRTTEWFAHNRGTTVLALLLWPAGVAAQRWRGRGPALALAGATFAILLGYDSTAASLALLLGGGAALLARRRPRLTAGLLGAIVVLGTALTPVVPSLLPLSDLAQSRIPTAVYHRMIIWDFAAAKIAERPFLGWGFNASRVLPGGDAEVRHPSGNVVPLMPLHPHNAVLQMWIELGLPGAALGAALMVLAVGGARRRPADCAWQSAALGLAMAGITVAFLSYGIWQRWWMSTLWLAAVFMVAARPGARNAAESAGQPVER